MTDDVLTAFIVALGSATVILSIFVAGRFWWHNKFLKGDSKRLTMALFGMLLGEACIGLVTLKFSILAWTGKLPSVPVELQSGLRFIAFCATSVTTIHLCRVVEDLNRPKK